MSRKRILPVVSGVALGVAALGLFGAGGLALAQDETGDGHVDLGSGPAGTDGYALASEHWDPSASLFGTVRTMRVEFTPEPGAGPVFVGLARAEAAQRYLDGVRYVNVSAAGGNGPVYTQRAGAAPASAPGAAGVWTRQVSGPGTQTLSWEVESGDWTLVAMNADGSPAVRGRVSMAATAPALPWLGGGMLVAGALTLGGAVWVWRRRRVSS